MTGFQRGDRVEYVGDDFWLGPDDTDWIRRGHKGRVVDLEPPDDAPIVSFDDLGTIVLQQADIQRVK
jgi:hypothetical protein